MDEFPVDSNDFYEILNVPKTATKADIKNSYHKLSLVFHPDKQFDSGLHAAAQKIFHKIHTAYTVLYDTKQREIYDKYGWEGIEAAWQLGPHLDQSEKLTEELRKRSNSGFGEIIQSKTSFTISNDFSEIVDDILDNEMLVYSDFLPKVSSIGLSESVETNFGADNFFSANFTTISQSGNVGAGNVNVNWRRPCPLLSNWMMENGFGFGSRKYVSMALIGQLDEKTTTSFQLVAGLKGGSVFPQFNSTLSRILKPNLIGNLQLIQPFSGSGQLNMSISTKTSAEVKSPLTVSLTLPTNAPFSDLIQSALLETKKTFFIDSKHEVRMKIGIQSVGGSFDLGIHRKWNEKTRASATLQLDQNLGTSLRLGITHKSLHLILPLRFSQEFSPVSIIIASLIPTISDYLSRNYVYPQLIKKRKEQYWREYKQKKAAMMERKRDEAELANELIKQNLEKKMKKLDDQELTIIEAFYRSIEHPDLKWSVSIPLQFLLNTEGKIRLDPAYRANVLGFFDVAPGEAKETFILYKFRGNLHEVIVPDTEELLLPQRCHLKD